MTSGGQGIRVRWRERQPVGHRDLTLEQDHRLALRRRHDGIPHGPGLVTGLTLSRTGPDWSLAPGMAVDRCGRSLVLMEPVTLPGGTVERLLEDAGAVDVWMRDPAPPTSHAAGVAHSRWDATPQVCLTAVGPGSPSLPVGPRPAGCGALDDDCGAFPVRLGRITDSASVPDGRPVGLVGAGIVAPAGDAQVQVGGVRAGERVRFAVRTGIDRVVVGQGGRVSVRGPVTVAGRLRLGDGGPPPGLHLRPLTPPPSAAMPWTLSRAKADDADDLRVEIGDPGDQGDRTTFRWTVGPADAAGAIPCLQVQADGTVRLRVRKLVVQGTVIRGPAKVDPADPRVASAMIANWLEGLRRTGADLNSADLRVTVTGFPTQTTPAGEEVSYVITLQNDSAGPLTGLTVADAITVDGVPLPGEGGFALHQAGLAPGAAVSSAERAVDAPDRMGATLTLFVVATATRTTGQSVVTVSSSSVRIGGGSP